MSSVNVIKQLADLADRNSEDLFESSIKIVAGHPEIEDALKEAQRRLQLAKNRELMDDHQIKLAYRLTIRNLVKNLRDN
jgi:UDP-N-acetylglucosamine transferase subunit ALG13